MAKAVTISKVGGKSPTLPIVGDVVKVKAIKPFCGIPEGKTWELTVTPAVLETIKDGYIKVI